jgi:hypothetical protein
MGWILAFVVFLLVAMFVSAVRRPRPVAATAPPIEVQVDFEGQVDRVMVTIEIPGHPAMRSECRPRSKDPSVKIYSDHLRLIAPKPAPGFLPSGTDAS